MGSSPTPGTSVGSTGLDVLSCPAFSAACRRRRVHGRRDIWAKPPDGLLSDGIPLPDVTHPGFVLDIDGVYVSCDPVNIFVEHDSLLEPVRTLQPEIGFLTTHTTKGAFPFFDGSAKVARRLGLKTTVPSHYACFVKRTNVPHAWASHVADVTPLIIPYDDSVIYAVPRDPLREPAHRSAYLPVL